MPGDESTTVPEQQALAEGVRQQQQELELLQAELRRDMQNLTETRDQLRQQQREQAEVPQRLERREREMADVEVEWRRETIERKELQQRLQQPTNAVRHQERRPQERRPQENLPPRATEGAATREQEREINISDEEAQPRYAVRIQWREVKPGLSKVGKRTTGWYGYHHANQLPVRLEATVGLSTTSTDNLHQNHPAHSGV